MKSPTRVGSGIILLYHRVAELARDPFGLSVPPSMFLQQMEYVQRTCVPLTLAEFAAAHSTQSLPQRAVAITFDDGYVDNLTTASPILARLNLPATFFVTTDRVDEPHEFWWDALVESVGEEETALQQVHEHAMRASLQERNESLDSWLRGRRPVSVATRNRPMIGDELECLATISRHEVGAHTVNHLFLPAQTPAICHAELHDCKQTLEHRLRKTVLSLAYPYGFATQTICEMATAVGFSIGVTVDPRAVSEDDHPLRLPRVPVNAALTDFSDYVERLFSAGGARRD